ncbi:tensin-4 [Rhinophrynus dorsalis]
MSQVIPNHVLRVGQTVCMASKEEGGGLRQTAHPRNNSMASKCAYFSTERYVAQGPSQTNGHVLSHPCVYNGKINQAASPVFRVVEKVDYNSQSAHQSVPAVDPKVSNGGNPMSPTLDISIENLNQLILQLDPTFQILPVRTGQMTNNSTQDTSPCVTDAPKMTSTPEIKCVELNSKRVVSQENMQQSSNPSPKSEGILISRGTQGDNYTPNGSVIFSEVCQRNTGSQSLHRRPSTGSCNQTTEGIPIPRHRSSQHDFTLSSSQGSETVHYRRPQFRNSEVSIMSNSPGSDTSYILGSTHSLPHEDSDGQHFYSRTTESPFGSLGSFSNLPSPGIMSPTTPVHYFDHNPEIYSPKLCILKYPNQSKMSPHTPAKGQVNSCPPSVNNSSMDIPILLINGFPESEDTSPKSSKCNSGGQQRRGSSSFNNSSKTCSESSIPACSDSSIKESQPGMKFVMHNSKHWFKPNITREQAIEFLREKEPGSFIIRDSTSFRGSFGLAMKVPGIPSKAGNVTNDLVRHFLIESSAKGVHLKGASEEPYFGSLSALVYQHTITPLSLPCKLVIPDKDLCDGESSPESPSAPSVSELKTTAACNVLYLNSVSTETLTGSSAIQKAVSATFEMSNLPMPTIVHFKATEQGVTLTDVQRKVFFRRHYPISTLSFCSVDPELRKWQKHCRSSRIFGFVAKNPTNVSDNVCHLFAEYDVVQPASPLISFLTNLIQQQEKV